MLKAIKKCWCSCFSERVMSHRLECGMPTSGLKMAVVVQVDVFFHPSFLLSLLSLWTMLGTESRAVQIV